MELAQIGKKLQVTISCYVSEVLNHYHIHHLWAHSENQHDLSGIHSQQIFKVLLRMERNTNRGRGRSDFRERERRGGGWNGNRDRSAFD
jgi:hypothetical protein